MCPKMLSAMVVPHPDFVWQPWYFKHVHLLRENFLQWYCMLERFQTRRVLILCCRRVIGSACSCCGKVFRTGSAARHEVSEVWNLDFVWKVPSNPLVRVVPWHTARVQPHTGYNYKIIVPPMRVGTKNWPATTPPFNFSKPIVLDTRLNAYSDQQKLK